MGCSNDAANAATDRTMGYMGQLQRKPVHNAPVAVKGRAYGAGLVGLRVGKFSPPAHKPVTIGYEEKNNGQRHRSITP